MKDFLAGGGNSVKTYQNTGILPSYVARPKIETKKKKPRITSGKFRKVKK